MADEPNADEKLIAEAAEYMLQRISKFSTSRTSLLSRVGSAASLDLVPAGVIFGNDYLKKELEDMAREMAAKFFKGPDIVHLE